MKKIVIFDALDTIMGYDGAEPGCSKRFYQEHLANMLGINVLDLNKEVPYEDQLELMYDELTKGNITPVILPGVEEMLSYVNSKGLTSLVLTADIQKSADLSSKMFVNKGLIHAGNIYGIYSLGSKKESSTWKKAQDFYFPQDHVVTAFEDTIENLDAALQAYNVNGFLVKHEDTFLTKTTNGFRGNMDDLINPFRCKMVQ